MAGRDKKKKGIVVEFEKEKETKGTVRYAEQGIDAGERGVVGTLYIQKTAAKLFPGGTLPDKLTITISA